MSESPTSQHTKRDGESMIAVGAFVLFQAMPVLLATIWVPGWFPATVNFTAGMVLLVTAVLFIWRGRRMLR